MEANQQNTSANLEIGEKCHAAYAKRHTGVPAWKDLPESEKQIWGQVAEETVQAFFASCDLRPHA